jgi:hypothetical protein
MKTILVAHRDETFAEQLTAELHRGGYHVIDCGGPWPPWSGASAATRAIARSPRLPT